MRGKESRLAKSNEADAEAHVSLQDSSEAMRESQLREERNMYKPCLMDKSSMLTSSSPYLDCVAMNM